MPCSVSFHSSQATSDTTYIYISRSSIWWMVLYCHGTRYAHPVNVDEIFPRFPGSGAWYVACFQLLALRHIGFCSCGRTTTLQNKIVQGRQPSTPHDQEGLEKRRHSGFSSPKLGGVLVELFPCSGARTRSMSWYSPKMVLYVVVQFVPKRKLSNIVDE